MFVTVLDRVAEVDPLTVPQGVEVEVIDIDELENDDGYAAQLSPEGRAYAKANGYL